MPKAPWRYLLRDFYEELLGPDKEAVGISEQHRVSFAKADIAEVVEDAPAKDLKAHDAALRIQRIPVVLRLAEMENGVVPATQGFRNCMPRVPWKGALNNSLPAGRSERT